MAEKIKKYLNENKMTIKDLAEKSGINVRILYGVFNNKRKLSADEYIAICNALNVSPDFFVSVKHITDSMTESA